MQKLSAKKSSNDFLSLKPKHIGELMNILNTVSSNSKTTIPIFFSTDDNYVPFLDIAIRSLMENASKDYNYEIVVLNTGLIKKNTDKIKLLENDNFKIDFADISYAVEDIKNKLPNLYHFGLAAYYRLFIQNLFPQYDKILYLDCDIVVLGDISKLYFTDIGDNNIAGVVDQIILRTKEFYDYTKYAVGVDCSNYINSGIMIMNLKNFREQKIEEKFIYLINKYNVDVIDPDQGYINFLCQGKIKYLPVSYNRPALDFVECDDPQIVHFNLYKKPWQYDDVYLGEHFWHYANKSPFYNEIVKIKNSFTEEDKIKKEQAGVDIKTHAVRTLTSTNTFEYILKNNPEEKSKIFDIKNVNLF